MITFSEFYTLYPRKVGRRAAEQEWVKAMKRGEDPLAILDGLKRNLPYLESRPMEFRPHPRTWLSQGRWEDEPQIISAPERKRTLSDAARDLNGHYVNADRSWNSPWDGPRHLAQDIRGGGPRH